MPTEDATEDEIRLGFPDDDLDDISTTSSRKSEQRDSYELDCILDEAQFEAEVRDDETGQTRTERVQMYLIKWTGYSIHEANYEKVEQLSEGYDQTLLDWQSRKMRIARGKEEPFDVKAWENECRDIMRKKYVRSKKRREKRRRRNLPLGTDPDQDPNYAEFAPTNPDDSSDDDKPLISRAARQSLTCDCSDDDEPLAGKRRKTSLEDDSDDNMPMAHKRIKSSAVPSLAKRSDRPSKVTVKDNKRGLVVPARKTSGSSRAGRQSPEETLPEKLHRRQPANVRDTRWSDAFKVKPKTKDTGTSLNSSTPNKPSANCYAVPPEAISALVGQKHTKMGPSTHMGKTLGSNTRKRVAGPGILDNWDAKRPDPKRKISGPSSTLLGQIKRCPTLQLQNVINKAARNDIAPSLDESQLQNLSAGTQAFTPRNKPPAPHDGNGIQSKMSSLHVATNDSPTIPPETPTEHEKGKPRTVPNGELVGSQNQAPLSGLLTCYFWASGLPCKYGKDCNFEHNDLQEVAPVNNQLGKDQVTCWFWFTRHCNKRPEECKFSHRMTRYLAPDNASGPSRRLGLNEKPRWMTSQERFNVSDLNKRTTALDIGIASPAPPAPPAFPGRQNVHYPPSHSHELGCWFFNFSPGGCVKTADECMFVHQKVPWVAQKSRRDQPIFNTKHFIMPTASADAGVPILAAAQDKALVENSPSPPPRSPHGRDESSHSAPTFTFVHHIPPSRPDAMEQDSLNVLPVRVRFRTANQKAVSSGTIAIDVKLAGFTKETRGQFLVLLQGSELLDIAHLCSAEDFRSFFPVERNQKHADGDISPTSDSTSDLAILEDTLRAYQAGAVIFHSRFSMLVYPVGPSGFSDVLKPSMRPSGGTTMRFCIFSPFDPPTLYSKVPEKGITNADEQPKPSTEPSISGLSIKRLFNSTTEKSAFLMFHPQQEGAMSQISTYLAKAGIKLYHSSTPGAWNYFSTDKKAGIVIFQSNFEAFDRLENLNKLLSTTVFQFFRLADRQSRSNPPSMPSSNPASPTTPVTPTSPFTPPLPRRPSLPDPTLHSHLDQIFYSGLAMYIMDDCFVHQPHDTRPALKRVRERVKRSPTDNKVLGRPGLMLWLSHLAAKEHRDYAEASANMAFNKADDMPISELYALLNDIDSQSSRKKSPSPLDLVSDSDDDGESPVYSLPPEHLPQYAPLWEKDEVAASRMMALWFSGWAIPKVGEFRRFVVLSMVSSVVRREWERKYRNLIVMTPDQFEAQEESRDAKKKKATR